MADMPKPPRKRQGQQTPQSSEKDIYTSDTETFTVPPELYDEQRQPGYGASDGYDPYDPPRRVQNKPRRTVSPQPAPPPRANYYDEAPANRQKPKPKKRKKHRRSSCLGRLLRGAAGLCLVVFALYSIFAMVLISKLERDSAAVRTVRSGQLGNSTYTRTVLLIGTDARDPSSERGRSDSMILLTINDATHEIYLSSLMRDCYVEIPGRGYDKLNAAYSYGGAGLLMDTIEQNFDVSIDDYVCVSFTGFAGLIDAFGGVEITLSDAEAQAVNVILQSEVNELMGDDPMSDFLPSGGTYTLSGKQALSYARIRYVGNADFERTSRQRKVMTQLMQNMKQHAVQAVPQLMESALPHISTNMSTAELYLLSLRVPFAVWYDTRQQQIPADGTWTPADIGGVSVLQIDTRANQDVLRDTAFAAQKSEEE